MPKSIDGYVNVMRPLFEDRAIPFYFYLEVEKLQYYCPLT